MSGLPNKLFQIQLLKTAYIPLNIGHESIESLLWISTMANTTKPNLHAIFERIVGKEIKSFSNIHIFYEYGFLMYGIYL